MTLLIDKAKSRNLFLIAAFFAVFALTEGAYRVNMLETAEHLYSDLWHRLSGVRYTPQHVALVTVDDQSLAKFSDDPLVFWTPLFAKAIGTLRKVRVSVIGVDFLFAITPEKWLGKLQLTEMDKLRNYDLPFREQLGSGQAILVGSRIKGGGKQQDTLLLPHQDYLLSLPEFDLVSHIGYADLLSDRDGSIRRYEITPRLDLAPELAEGAPRFTLGALLALRVGKQQLTGHQWQMGSHTFSAAQQADISYAGPPGTIHRIPFSRLLADGAESDPDVRALQGKVVIIGGDFFGMNDVHSTPYSGSMAGGLMTGPEIQANIVETLLSGKATESVPSWARWAVFAGLIGMSLIAYAHMSPWFGLGVLTGCFSASLLLSLVLFKFFYLFPAAHLQFGLVAGYMLSYGRRLTAEEREKGRIRRLFGRYVSDNLVDVLLESDRLPDLGGESVTITVLFSDIRNFTTISEILNAHEVVEFLNYYFNLACEPILANDGSIDKFIGDAIMVQFGAPLIYPDHAVKALHTAVAMRQVAVEFKQWMIQRFPGRGLPEFAIGIGIHTGKAVVGNVGCTKRIEYTAIGDTVNIASRLESSSKTLGFDIVASADTLRAAGDVVRTGGHDVIKVKGKEAPIEVFEVIGLME